MILLVIELAGHAQGHADKPGRDSVRATETSNRAKQEAQEGHGGRAPSVMRKCDVMMTVQNGNGRGAVRPCISINGRVAFIRVDCGLMSSACILIACGATGYFIPCTGKRWARTRGC
jgi:hypothetical protein